MTGFFRSGLLVVAFIMLIAAGLLIANTVRVGLYARRREIGIMKLVGATNWFIRVPFIVEGLVTALVGALLAIGMLALLMALFVKPAEGAIPFLPLVDMQTLLTISPWILLSGLGVAIVASFLGMRRFLDI